MGKVLALFFILFMAIHALGRLIGIALQKNLQESASHPAGSEAFDMMICCPTCTLYIPSKKAIAYKGKLFCCQEHARPY